MIKEIDNLFYAVIDGHIIGMGFTNKHYAVMALGWAQKYWEKHV